MPLIVPDKVRTDGNGVFHVKVNAADQAVVAVPVVEKDGHFGRDGSCRVFPTNGQDGPLSVELKTNAPPRAYLLLLQRPLPGLGKNYQGQVNAIAQQQLQRILDGIPPGVARLDTEANVGAGQPGLEKQVDDYLRIQSMEDLDRVQVNA